MIEGIRVEKHKFLPEVLFLMAAGRHCYVIGLIVPFVLAFASVVIIPARFAAISPPVPF